MNKIVSDFLKHRRHLTCISNNEQKVDQGEQEGLLRVHIDSKLKADTEFWVNRDFAFFCVWTNETSASRNLRSYLVLQRLCNEAALSPGIDAFLY